MSPLFFCLVCSSSLLLLLFQEHACLLLRKAEDSGLFKVKKAERGVAICVAVTLLTCRQWRRGQTMKEMSTMFNVSLKALNKAVKVSEPTPPLCVARIW